MFLSHHYPVRGTKKYAMSTPELFEYSCNLHVDVNLFLIGHILLSLHPVHVHSRTRNIKISNHNGESIARECIFQRTHHQINFLLVRLCGDTIL